MSTKTRVCGFYPWSRQNDGYFLVLHSNTELNTLEQCLCRILINVQLKFEILVHI